MGLLSDIEHFLNDNTSKVQTWKIKTANSVSHGGKTYPA